MEKIQISKFKAICLATLERMGRMREPVAQVLPASSPTREWLGAMRDDGEIRDDLVAPAADRSEWDVIRQMGLLLDTHICLWSLLDPDGLGDSARNAMQSGETKRRSSPFAT